MPYRDNAPTSELSAFATHVAIAETLLDVHADLIQQLAVRNDPELDRSRLQTWGDLWEQLDQARAILLRGGRNVLSYDKARERAGDRYLAAGGATPISGAMLAATRDAIDTLRAAVPEVVIPSPQRASTAHRG